MIVFLDANVVMQDPTCSGVVWQVLAHAPDSWELRLVTSEVVVAEAVAGYERQVAEAIDELSKLASKWGRLGLGTGVASLRDALQKKVKRYQDDLMYSLEAVGADVLPVPAVSHMQVVERSVARRRPCDKHGNGYRDTLVWLTVLELTASNIDAQLVLVTNDQDFMDARREGLHPDLVEDISNVAESGRVRLAKSLADIMMYLAEKSPDQAYLMALKAELKEETVRRYVASLASSLEDTPLNIYACALPPLCTTSYLQSVGPIDGLKIQIRGGVGDGAAVAAFTFEADAHIVLTLPSESEIDDENATCITKDSGHCTFIIVKRLLFGGLIQLGRLDRPLGGEISSVMARSDDPGWEKWRTDLGGLFNVDTIGNILGNININVNPMNDYLKNTTTFNPMNHYLKNSNINMVNDYLNNTTTFNPMNDHLKNMNINLMNDYLKSMKMLNSMSDGDDDSNANQPNNRSVEDPEGAEDVTSDDADRDDSS